MVFRAKHDDLCLRKTMFSQQAQNGTLQFRRFSDFGSVRLDDDAKPRLQSAYGDLNRMAGQVLCLNHLPEYRSRSASSGWSVLFDFPVSL